MLLFRLLGQVELSKNGVPLSQFRSQKEVALLIYLAQTEQTHSRDFIAELLWDSRSTKQALSNLRTLLTRLRKQVGDALVVTRKTLALSPKYLQDVDSITLLQTLDTVGAIDSVDKATAVQNILEAYQGGFLNGFHLRNAPQFDEWMVTMREHIHRQVIAAYSKLGQYAASSGDFDQGLAIARRWLEVDAFDEAAHTLLMQLLIKTKQEREAIIHYEYCTQLLQNELGIAPPAAMTALLNDIQQNIQAPTQPAPLFRHNLPISYDQFFGRESIQQEIHARLDQPWCRLVTVTGQGGMGKTRLATTIARSRLAQYRDGVWFIELAEIDSDDDDLAEAIAVEIATILDLRLTGSTPPIEQLLSHLQHKQMMLLLDNFEHLLDGDQIVVDILQRCEQVQLVVTSREALKLRAEWMVTLDGLSYPDNSRDETPSDAVDLFAARRAQQHWEELPIGELTAIRSICRMVEGLPLAIELAAALTRFDDCQAIAERLEDGFDSLKATLDDVPERHRGMYVVFEMSWRTLTSGLQQRLARLAYFRGGFDKTAVYQITDTTPQHLNTLAEKSLLTYSRTNQRYRLHPVIQAYAEEFRPPDAKTPQKHTRYYLALLADYSEPLQKDKPQDAMAVLEPNIDNIRLAWQTGLKLALADELLDGLTSLSTYFQLRGLALEGEAVMQETVKATAEWKHEGLTLATHAKLEQARFLNRLGKYRPAIEAIKKTVRLAELGDDPWAEGMAHVWWGESLWRLGEYESAKIKLNHALEIGHVIEEALIIGWCHHQLGIVHDLQGQLDKAFEHIENACTTWEILNNIQALSGSLNSMGLIYHHQGKLLEAQNAMEQALTLCDQLGDRFRKPHLINTLSLLATEQEDFSGAIYYLTLGLNIAVDSGNQMMEGAILINLGRNYFFLEEYESAEANLTKGLEISKSIGDSSLIVPGLLNLGNIKQKMSLSKEAESFYMEALEICQMHDLQSHKVEALINLAKLFAEINEEKAKTFCKDAVLLAKSIRNPNLIEEANSLESLLFESGNYQ